MINGGFKGGFNKRLGGGIILNPAKSKERQIDLMHPVGGKTHVTVYVVTQYSVQVTKLLKCLVVLYNTHVHVYEITIGIEMHEGVHSTYLARPTHLDITVYYGQCVCKHCCVCQSQ